MVFCKKWVVGRETNEWKKMMHRKGLLPVVLGPPAPSPKNKRAQKIKGLASLTPTHNENEKKTACCNSGLLDSSYLTA